MENKQLSKFSFIVNEDFIHKGGMSNRLIGIKEELDWMRRQSEYAIFSSKYKLRYDLKRGEIYQIDWGININNEFSSVSYGVVVTDSNIYNPLVLVCPLKSKKGNYGLTSRNSVELGIMPELKKELPFNALVNHIRPIDKVRILIDGKTMDEINQTEGQFNDPENEIENSKCVSKLSDDKMNMIIKMYINMIVNGD